MTAETMKRIENVKQIRRRSDWRDDEGLTPGTLGRLTICN